MDQKNNGLKVNISNEGVEKPLRKTKKVVKEKIEQFEKPKSVSKKNSLLSTVISVIVTALVVGGGIYAWQGDKVEQTVDKIKNDFRNERVDLEKKMDSIKDRAQGLETELGELKTKNEKLSEAEALLAGAKIEFFNPDLGLRFDYPATLGEAKVTIENGEGGKTIKGAFSKNDKIYFGGVSKNYQKKSTSSSSTTELLEFQGFKEQDKKYFFLAPTASIDGYEIKSAGDINTAKGKAMLLNNKSFKTINASSTELQVNIGGNLAAIININNPDFGGIVFVDSDFGSMKVDDFKKMIGSIK